MAAKAKEVQERHKPVNTKKGLLLASIVAPVGIAAWVILWQMGFIASIVAFGVAYGAVWLYKKGSGDDKVQKAVLPLLAIILVTVILAFLAGVVSDGWYAYTTKFEGTESFWSAEFWGFIGDNFANADLWSQYVGDIVISIAFAALGAGSIVMELVTNRSKSQKQPAAKK